MSRNPSSVLSQRGTGNSKTPPLGIKIYIVLGVIGLVILAVRIPLMAGFIPGVGGLIAAVLASLFGIANAISLVGLWRVAAWGWGLATAVQAISFVLYLLAGSTIGLGVTSVFLIYFAFVRDFYLD